MAPEKMGDEKEGLPQVHPRVEDATSAVGYSAATDETNKTNEYWTLNGLRRIAPEAMGNKNEGLSQAWNPLVEDASLAVRYSSAPGNLNTANEHGTLNGLRRLAPEAMGIVTRLPQANSQVKDAILAIGHSGVPDDANTASEHWKIWMEGMKLRMQRKEAYDEQMKQLNGLRRLEPQPALPEFNPEEAGGDALAWCELVDMVLCELPLQSDALIAALNMSLKGSASTWLSQVTYEGMTWAEFKINFLACYGSENTCAATMISINKSRPKADESYAAYASRLAESFVNKWKSLTPEQIAISFVLAHISQFDSRVQRMAHTTEIMTRERLVQELNEIFNLKHKLEPNPAEDTDVPEKRTRSAPVQRPARKFKNTKIKTATPRKTRATATKSKPATATATSSKLACAIPGICYLCGKEGHHTINCPKPSTCALRDPGASALWLPGPSGPSDPGPSGLPEPGPRALSNPGPSSLSKSGHSALSAPGLSALSEPVPSGLSDPGPTGFIKTFTPRKTKRATATKSKPATATATSSKLACAIPGICYLCGKEGHHTINCAKPSTSALRDPGVSALWLPGPSGLSDPGPSGLPEPGPRALSNPGPSSLSAPGPSALSEPVPSGLSDPGPTGFIKTFTPRKTKRATVTNNKPATASATSSKLASVIPEICFLCGKEGHHSINCPKPSTIALRDPGPGALSEPGPTGFIKTATPRKLKRATATKFKPATATATSSKLANTIPEICYLCGKEGHHIINCPKPSTSALRDPGPSTMSEPGPSALWLPGPSGQSDPGPSGLPDPRPSCMSKPGLRGLSAQGPSDLSEPGPSRESLVGQRHSKLNEHGCVCCGPQPPVGTLRQSGLSSTDNMIFIEIDADENQNLNPTNEQNKSTEKYAEDINRNVITKVEDKATNVYTELVLLEQRALVANTEEIECGICMDSYQPGQGVVLRECLHAFCQECLSDVVKHSEEPVVMCPAMDCSEQLQQREIRALVPPDVHERWLAKGLAAAESGTQDAFHCQTRDCQGWAMCDPGVTRFHCPVCNIVNCVTCKAIHESETCSDYRARLNPDETTETYLKDMLSRGEAMRCPKCRVIITKQVGCDFIMCAACKTEICWATRGPRWGPRGRGDTSGGCRCNFNRKKCHPSCQNCH